MCLTWCWTEPIGSKAGLYLYWNTKWVSNTKKKQSSKTLFQLLGKINNHENWQVDAAKYFKKVINIKIAQN